MRDDDDDIPKEGVFTDQRLLGRAARVWWQREVMLAFPKVSERLMVLDRLEETMINCGTTTIFYHCDVIATQFLTFESAEDEGGVIYVNVKTGTPIHFYLPELSEGRT